MRECVKNFLVKKYNELDYKSSCTCLKYHYKYNGVNVNIYFDAYDLNSLSLYLVLIYEQKYYYTPLNISNTNIHNEYLKEIPQEILNQILENNHLVEFYSYMEEYIKNNNPIPNSYKKDKIFINTLKYSKDKTDLPFWYHIRRVRMSDETLKKLSAKADISIKTLKSIQNKNLTLVRTADVAKRKELTFILGGEGITI
ncbi:TPA: hypothetical protein ACHTER_001482 [Clostridioides difficile]